MHLCIDTMQVLLILYYIGHNMQSDSYNNKSYIYIYIILNYTK